MANIGNDIPDDVRLLHNKVRELIRSVNAINNMVVVIHSQTPTTGRLITTDGGCVLVLE